MFCNDFAKMSVRVGIDVQIVANEAGVVYAGNLQLAVRMQARKEHVDTKESKAGDK